MGKETGFIEYKRVSTAYRDPKKRIQDFDEFLQPLSEEDRKIQAARCMDCGVPFCQSDNGCPVDNLIPEWNDLVYRGEWQEAFYRLIKTNNFPEFTGRVCPAPCEHACVLGINEPAITIKDNECTIIDRAYKHGLMKPRIPKRRTGKKIAIIGSGPAGLASADQLNQVGHRVEVFERDDRIGGLLMYGIPNMKLSKELVQRRVDLLSAEGIVFRPGVAVGSAISGEKLLESFDAVLVAVGSTRPRDLPIDGRSLEGVHYAMDFLRPNTKSLLDSQLRDGNFISAKGKHVVVIGGGDTGNDCIGTAMRHGCKSLTNFELLAKPPKERGTQFPWPTFARTYKLDYGHAEAAAVFDNDPREYGILSERFIGENGKLTGIQTVRVRWEKPMPGQRPSFQKIEGTEEHWECDLALLSMGFVGPEPTVCDQLGITLDEIGRIDAQYGSFATNVKKVFTAGDARRGQSLVVWAIKEGRGAAKAIDTFLCGSSTLPD